jgi:hypothetical protein
MQFINRISEFKVDGLDLGLTKIAVFGATLMVAKLWPAMLALEWYWYMIVWVLAAIHPFRSVYKWFINSNN